MTKSHLAHLAAKGLLVLLAGLPLASRAGEPLILVEDRGGTSALPYYEALSLQPRANTPARSPIPATQIPATPADEAAMLP
ncbi:integrating conjugative element protein, partial [Pseudomonas aeruginosa]|nr:integrating conjugative element protein [Pseudomonas aeruginosa]